MTTPADKDEREREPIPFVADTDRLLRAEDVAFREAFSL